MTKKIDEAVSLNVSSSEGEMTSNTTFTAEDTAALAVMLKNAGIAGNSTMFNGPATMTVDAVEGTSSMSTIIQAPDLRSIMQLLEPEFAAAAEMDGIVDNTVADQQSAEVDHDAALDSIEIAPETPVDALDDMPADVDDSSAIDADLEFVDDQMGSHGDLGAGEPIIKENMEDDFYEMFGDEDLEHARQRPNEVLTAEDESWEVGAVFVPANTIEYMSDEDEDHDSEEDELRDSLISRIAQALGNELRDYSMTTWLHFNEETCEPDFTVDNLFWVGWEIEDSDEDEDYDDDDYDDLEDDDLDHGSALGRHTDESVDYDYRDHDVEPKPYAGVADRKPVQPKTKRVPARSGDNPLEEDIGETFSFRTYFELGGQEVEANVKYTVYGDRTEVESVVNDTTGDEILPQLPREMVEKLTAHAADDFKSNSKGVEAQGRTFADYFNEAKMRNHVAPKKSVGSDDLLDEFRLNELSSELKGRYATAAHASKSKHEKRAAELDDLVHDAKSAEDMGIVRKGATDRVARVRNGHDRTAWKREKGLDRLGQLDEISDETKNSYFKKAAADINNHANHSDKMRGIGNHDQADKHDAKIMKRAQGMNRAIAREEEELDEAGYNQRQQKVSQYGKPFYLNTDCGYASLESIVNGTAEYFDDMSSGSSKIGVTVLEINRNGKTGFNYITGLDRSPAGTKVTCVTATSTGEKYRPGKVITSFTANDLVNNYEMVVDQLAAHGISPSKKLPVKTFD